MNLALTLALAAVVGAACGPVSSSTPPRTRPASSEHNVLTKADIDRSGAGTAFDAIQKLRGEMLRSRRVSNPAEARPRVYIDQIPTVFDVDELRSIQASSIVEIRYLSELEATARYGGGHRGGAIHVTTLGGLAHAERP